MTASRIDLLKDLHRIKQELDTKPTTADLTEQGGYPAEAYIDEFGSLKEALKRIGVDPPEETDTQTIENPLLHELQRLADSLGRKPMTSDVRKRGKYGMDEYREKYGSWINALVEAEVVEFDFPDTSDNPNMGYSDRELIVELWRMAEYYGPPSVRDMDNWGKYSSSTYRYRYGSWNSALQTAGLQPREAPVDADARPKAAKHYGRPEWKSLREEALKRDEYECQRCGRDESEQQGLFGVGLSVHHIQDVSDHGNPEDADELENLETLCSVCHGQTHTFDSN